MSSQTLTITLPDPIARRVQHAAKLTYRSVDDIITSSLLASPNVSANLPPDLAAELEAMHFMSDDMLRAQAQSALSPAEQMRLQQLNQAAGERELTAAETAEQEALLEAYQRAVLQRAQALAVLQLRGHPIDQLLELDTTP